MAIVKRGSRVSRLGISSTKDDGPTGNSSRPYSDEDDEVDSGAASDSSQSSDVGEKGTELCRVGDQNCKIPYELFDLPDLRPILSLDTWNHCLTDDDRFSLSAYLPDMDQQTFMITLKELLAGENFHFGSPLFQLFDRLKGGLCQPEVARYREGLEYLQRKEHYHFLRKYQNTMVNSLLEMRGTWEHCRNLGIEEKLKIWNSWKDQKPYKAAADSQCLSQRGLEHNGESLQKGKAGRAPTRLSNKPSLAKDEKMLEMDPYTSREKGLTTEFDGRFPLAGMVPSHKNRPLDFCTGLRGAEETEKMGKRVPKGVLKMKKNGKTEMQLEIARPAPCSEVEDFEAKSKSLSRFPHANKWENDEYVKETSVTMRKTRSRTKINGSETAFDNTKGHQAWAYFGENAGFMNSAFEHRRILGRVKEQEVSERIGVQVPPNCGKNRGHFREGNNLTGWSRTVEDFKRRGERATISTQYVTEEMPKERASMISSKDLRKYPRKTGLPDVSLYAEGHGQYSHTNKRNPIDYHKTPVQNYQEPSDQDVSASKALPIVQEMILDDKKLDKDEIEIHQDKKQKNDRRKTLEQLKNKDMEIIQSSKEIGRSSTKQKISVGGQKLEHQLENIEGQSELVENRQYTSGISSCLDKSKRSHEGKKKKRKQRQIDDVMTFDVEKKQEESPILDGPKEDMKTLEGFDVAIKDTETSETDEILPPLTDESKGMAKFGVTDKKAVSNMHNGAITSLCQKSVEGTLLQKRTKKTLKADFNVVDGRVSNGSHVVAEPTLDKQAQEEKPLKNKDKKTSKEEADVLAGVTELDGLHNNSQISPCWQAGGLKTLKRGAKKKLEDSEVLDGLMEAGGIHINSNSTMSLDSDECKATNKKTKKMKVDSEVLNGLPELNALQGDDSPSLWQQSDEGRSGEKRNRRKMNDTTRSVSSLPSKQASTDDKDAKASKKSFPLVMPHVVSSFSFSVIHFLSAVRIAMLSPSAEDISEVVNHSEKSDGERESSNQERHFTLPCNGKVEEQNSLISNHPLVGRRDMCMEDSVVSHLERERQASSYSIPFQEIVKRVQMNPGDPCVLEIQEPLQDLVRGALKIFASKTAPPGIKGWKPLALYDKSSRSWSWIGSVSSSSPGRESLEVQISSEAWGISQKMLLKLVEAFANWLKNGQETLQQIVLLPSPPPPSMPTCLDDKERFRELRAQKSSITITPSSPDMRAYFRREEVLRYSVPDRAFPYTAADGRKAVVAPLRRCGGKPTSKARDHFMLKPDRPPHVTILCLVRDAAARLPGSIGTRADVCILIRDSQYIVEDVSDAQVNQVVSGALDRLHYERDPCVQFDGERKLWVYLHTERNEEDFEDDGTSSTKRWKRQKKDNVDNSDLGPCNDNAYHCVDDQDACGSGLGFDFCTPDYTGDSSSIYSGGKAELVYNRNGSLTSPRVLRSFNGSNIDDSMVPFIELPPSISIPGSMHESHPMGWEVLGLNRLGHGSNIQTQEQTSNGDFDDTFGREKPIELLSTTLL